MGQNLTATIFIGVAIAIVIGVIAGMNFPLSGNSNLTDPSSATPTFSPNPTESMTETAKPTPTPTATSSQPTESSTKDEERPIEALW